MKVRNDKPSAYSFYTYANPSQESMSANMEFNNNNTSGISVYDDTIPSQ